MAANPEDSNDYATKADLRAALDDMRASINRDLRHALDEALGRQSTDLNRRMDQRFEKIEGELAEIKAAIKELARP